MAGAAGLISEAVAWASHPSTFGVAALDHEVGDDAVEDCSIVELGTFLARAIPIFSAVSEADEVGDGLRSVFLKELGNDGALVGLERGVHAGFGWHFRGSPYVVRCCERYRV